MSLDLKPVQYLEMLKAEHEEHKKYPLSMRKVKTCCALSNASRRSSSPSTGLRSPKKVHGGRGHPDYREHLRGECEAQPISIRFIPLARPRSPCPALLIAHEPSLRYCFFHSSALMGSSEMA
jgi:hypothetical protein